MNQVQEKDKSQTNGTEAEETQTEELPFELKGESDLERLFDEHPKFLDEFNKDPKAFIEKYGNHPEKEEKPDKPAEGEDDWFAEEKGKPAEEPKKPETKPEDSGAGQLENQLKDMNGKLQDALKQIEDLKKGKTEKEKTQIASDLKDIDLSNLAEIPDDIDLFSEDGQEQAKKQIKALTQAVKDVTALATSYKARLSEIENLKTDVGTVKADVGSMKSKAEQREVKETADDAVVSEFKLIDKMVGENKEVFGEKVRPVKAIEDDYLDGIDKMLKLAKSTSPVVQNNQYTKDALRVLELYTGTTDKAKRFQALCKEAKAGLPEDVDVLNKVYEIRKIREELSFKDDSGKIIKMPAYEKAVENYMGRHIGETRVKDRIENRGTFERALENRKRFAPETKPGAAPEEEDILKMPRAEVDRILNKIPKERTKQERELAYKILVSVGTPEDEARDLSGLDEKE